ncbi:OsmC family protein [Wenzhouxiangella limi]|uniref:OsmC family protein n=1 Tax=Wenzhouxiangella limi TaxID=2707351 RepID=A0A845VG84_9GAMM|nr:OsmC family protein [Wenzhouxiangella limi]NDY96219.1 OsmC family protein [Wenzhouxiangella limi]
MKRNARARWEGGLKDGAGTLFTESGVLKDQQYSFRTRFEDGKGTNPEELIGAAHAGCYAMALSLILGEAGFTADYIDAEAVVELQEVDGAPTITSVALNVVAKVPEADDEAFLNAAEAAKKDCPVSRLLNAKISLDARLAG